MPDTYTDWSAKNPITDPVESLRSFNDYSRAEYLRAGQLTPELNEEMDNNAFQFAVEKGLIPAPADEAALQESLKSFVLRPQSDSVLALAGDKLSDEGNNEGALKVRGYLAAKRQAGTPTVTDQEEYATRLESLRKEAEPFLDENSLNNAKRYAVTTGKAKFATVIEDGRYRVIADPALGELDDATIAAYASANPDLIDSRALPQIQQSFRKIPGLDVTPAQLERKGDIKAQMLALANRDPDAMRYLESAVKGFKSDNRTTGKKVTSGVLAVPAFAAAAVGSVLSPLLGAGLQGESLLDKLSNIPSQMGKNLDALGGDGVLPESVDVVAHRLSGSELGKFATTPEIAEAVRDFAITRGVDSVEFDEKNPTSAARRLSTGMYAIPKRIQVNKDLFNKTLEALPVTKDQKALMTQERDANLDAYAKELIPQLIQAKGSLADVYQTAKDAGKSDGEIVEQIAASGDYNGAINRLESFGISVGRILTDLIPAIGALTPGYLGKGIKDIGYSLSRDLSSEQAANSALAGVFGKDFGWGQQLVEQTPQLVANILVSRGMGSAAGAIGRGLSSGGKIAARSLLGAEAATTLANFTQRTAGRAVSVVGKTVADDFAKALKAAPNEIGWLTSQGASVFGSTYSSTRSSLEAQRAPDGSKKFTSEQVENMSTEAAALSAFWSNVITLGMNRIGGGKLAGVETLATGRGVSMGKLKSYYDDVVKGVEKLAPEVRSQISLADFDTFARDVVKTALSPAKGAIFGGLGEGAEEFIQNIASDVVQSAVTGKNFDLTDSARAAGLAASFGLALGSGSKGVELLEQKYRTDPAYQQAEFEASYLSRTIDNLKANGAPATATFLQRQLDLAQQNKETIRTRLTQFAADEEAAAQAQVAADAEEFDVFERRAARDAKLIPVVGPAIFRANGQYEFPFMSRAVNLGTSEEATPPPQEAANYEQAELGFGPPQNLVSSEGPAVERANGQFEFPFMARWLDLGFTPGTSPVPQANYVQAELPLGEEQQPPLIRNHESESLILIQESTTPEQRTAFVEAAPRARQQRFANIGAEVEKIDARLAALDRGLAQLKEQVSAETAATEQELLAEKVELETDKADLLDLAVGEIVAPLASPAEVEAVIAAATVEVPAPAATEKPETTAAKKRVSRARAVQAVVETLENSENPEALLAAAEEAAAATPADPETAPKTFVYRSTRRRDNAPTPENIQLEAPAATVEAAPIPGVVEGNAEASVEENVSPRSILDEVIAMQAAAKANKKKLRQAAADKVAEESAKFTRKDVAPLLDTASPKVDLGLNQTTHSRLTDTNSESGFLTPQDYTLFQDLLARGVVPRLDQVSTMLKSNGSYGDNSYAQPFYGSLKAQVEAVYPVYEAPAQPENLTVDPEILYPLNVRLSSIGQRLQATKEILEARIDSLVAERNYKENRTRLKHLRDAVTRIDYQIADRMSTGDYQLMRKPESGEIRKAKRELSVRGRRGGGGPKQIKLAVKVSDEGEVVGFHTNDLYMTAWLLNNNFSIFVPKNQRAEVNPNIDVSKNGHVQSVTLPDGQVVNKAGDLNGPIGKYLPEELKSYDVDGRTVYPYFEFTNALPEVPRNLTRLLGATPQGNKSSGNIALAESEWITEAQIVLYNSTKGSALAGVEATLAAAQIDPSDFAFAVVNRYRRNLREFTLAIRIEEKLSAGEDFVKFLSKEIGDFAKDALVKAYSQKAKTKLNEYQALKAYGESLLRELRGEVKDDGGSTRFFKKEGDAMVQKPNALDTIIAQLARKYSHGIGIRDSYVDPTARIEDADTPELLSQADADDLAASMYSSLGGATLLDIEIAPEETEAEAAPETAQSVLRSVISNVDANPQTRKAFERTAAMRGVTNAESLPTETLIDLVRNEVSEDIAKAVDRAMYILRGGTDKEQAALRATQSSEDGEEAVAKSIAIANRIKENKAVAALLEKQRLAGVFLDTAKKDILRILSSNLPYGARMETNTSAEADDSQNARLEALFERNPFAKLVREVGASAALEIVGQRVSTQATLAGALTRVNALINTPEKRAAFEQAQKYLFTSRAIADRRVVKASLQPIADFEAFVREQAAQVGLQQDIASKRAGDRAAKSRELSPETAELLRLVLPSTPGPSGTVVSRPVPDRLFTPEQPQGVEAIPRETTRESGVAPITLESGTPFTREQLEAVLKRTRDAQNSESFSEQKRDQMRRYADMLESKLSNKRRQNFKVGKDIEAVFKSIAVPGDPATNLRNNLIDADTLGLRGGSILSAIEALDKVPVRLREVAALLKESRAILAKANIEIVNLPNTGWAGKYSPESNTIFLNLAASNGRGLADVLVHEMLHAVTVSVIKNPNSAAARALVTKLDALRGRIKAAYKGDSQQVLEGLASLEEFVSYAFTSPDFQKAIYEAAPERNFFRRFIDFLTRFLTGNPTDQLSKTLNDLTKLVGMANMRPYGTRISEDVAMSRDQQRTKELYSLAIETGSRSDVAAQLTELDKKYLTAVERGDMEAAQRMVDEAARAAGYSEQVYYHGTKSGEFFVFDNQFAGSNYGPAYEIGKGFYFAPEYTTSRTYAEQGQPFGGRVISAKLKLGNNLQLDGLSLEQAQQVLREFSSAMGDSFTPDNAANPTRLQANVRNTFSPRIKERSDGTYGVQLSVNNTRFSNAFGYGIEEVFRRMGYDSVSDGWQTVVFEPSQIKSADPVTRDGAGNVIPLSQRFNPASGDIRYSQSIEGGGLGDASLMSSLLTQESPSGITIRFDESARGMMVARPDTPDTVFVNPQLLARAIEGLSEFNARRFVRAAVNHEIAHLAAFSALSEADIDYIALNLTPSQLWEVADRYYSATVSDAAARFERIREDRAAGKLSIRELADEFVRMELEKARSGFISESDYSFYRRNPGMLSRMLRALEAFIAKLTTRIRGIEDSEIAASVQRATRVYNQMVSSAEPNGFEEQLNVLRRDDVTGRFSLPIENYGKNSYDVGGKFSRLFKGDLPSAIRALVGTRDNQLRLVARISEQFNNQMQAFIKSGVVNDENLTLVRNAMGDTGLVISKARMAQIEAVLDGEITNIEKAFEDSAKTESDKLIHDKGIADSVARHKDRVVKEYQLVADKARAAAAEAKAKLPPKVVKVIEDARAAIDKASGKIAANPFTPDDIRIVIDANMGIYLTRSYYAFTQTGWTKLLKSAGIAQVGNATIDFQKIRDNALKHYTNKASKKLEAEIKKAHPEFSPAEVKAAVLRDTPARAQVMFDEFVASMDKNAADLAAGQVLAVDVEKALFEEGSTEPAVRTARTNELRQELSRFAEKKELPEWLRQALGEITDPIEAATRSLISVSKLAANQDLLTSTLEAGLDGGWITKDPVVADQKGYIKLSGANPAYDAPLDGAYGPPEFKKAFDTIFSKSSPELEDTADQAVRNGIKILRATAGGAMASKTLLSVGFYPRNAASDFGFFAPLQGVLLNPFNFKRWFQSKGAAFAKSPGEHEAYIRELIELGVLGDDSGTQALRDQIAGLATDAEAALNKVERSALAAQGEAFWKKAGGVPSKILSLGADLNNTISSNLRIGMFEHELAVLREAYKGDETWTEARLKKEAAAKVLRTTQTHSQVFPVVTSFTKSGLGSLIAPFARFKAEVARVMIETVKLASEERASDNEIIRKRGNQRLAGFLTTLTLMPLTVAGVVSLAYAAAFGDDEDVTADSILNYFLPRNGDELRRDQALREGLADWQKGNTVYFTQVGDKIRALDMTFINPTAVYTDLIMRSYELIRTGKEAEIPAVAAKWVTGQLIGDQIAIGAAMEAFNNKDEKGNPITTGDTPFLEALVARTTYALSQGYKPPVANFVQNLMSGEKGSRKPVTEDDKASNRLEIFAGEMFGVRPRVDDVSVYHNRAIRSAALTYSQSRRATGILKSRSPLDADQITESIQKANRARVAAFGTAAELMRAYENMGMTRGQLFSASNEAGLSKDRLNKALNNITDRWTPSREDSKEIYDAGQKADGNGAGRLKQVVTEALKYPAVQVLNP